MLRRLDLCGQGGNRPFDVVRRESGTDKERKEILLLDQIDEKIHACLEALKIIVVNVN